LLRKGGEKGRIFIMEHFVSAKIWEPMNQVARAMRYEVPLSSALNSQRMGVITGVAAAMTRELEIESFQYEMILSNLDKAVEVVKLTLEGAGAPCGSEIRFRRGDVEEVVSFGRKEGLAIYLDGINLPDKVYETCTCQGLADLIKDAVDSVGGEIRGSWVGPSETSIYIYGPDAESMFTNIEPIIETYPLCQNARVVIRHGNPVFHPRTVRLPLHENTESGRQVYWNKGHGTG
jgi:hypothetical protein